MITKITIIIFTLLITGCSSIQPSLLPTSPSKIVYVKIPDYLLEKCAVDKPIDQDTYMKLTLSQRESILTEYIITLYSTISKCNKQIEKIRNINENK